MSLRHHLLTTCSECETLTKLYKKQLTSLDNEECHAHLRCVPFDLSLRLPGDKTLDQFVSQAREVSKGDSRLDRYNPAKLHLAVQELDEKHVGCFSFRTKGDITKVCIGRMNTVYRIAGKFGRELNLAVWQYTCIPFNCQTKIHQNFYHMHVRI